MLAWMRAGLILLGTALVLLLVLAVTKHVDRQSHTRYSEAMRRSRELDVRLSKEVAKSRLGIVRHYDELVRVDDELASVRKRLGRIPGHVSEADRTRLEAKLEQYDEVLGEKRRLLERFKSEHAILRNSVRAFPRAAERLRRRIARKPDSGELHDAVQRLEYEVMRLALSPSRELAERTRCALRAFVDQPAATGTSCQVARVAVPEDLGRPLDTVRSHARIVLERHGSTERLVTDIMTLPVGERIKEATARYDASHQAAEAASRARWAGVVALAAALLILGGAYIIVRLKNSAAALRETTGKLEDALEALAHERDREKELSELKSRFVSMTSHEFRTPLSVILSSSELLEAYWKRWADDKREMHLERVQDAAQKMSRMLDGVLLIGRVEAGMLELSAQPLDLSSLCRAIVEEIRSVVGAERELRFVDKTPAYPVRMDEKLLRHMLLNLLSNAFKYSPEDSVVVFEVSHEEGVACFEVRDQGIGIPEEEQDSLFGAFHRCSNASGIAGNGLGLAVVKKSLEVHGGSIEVDSTVGEGTTFRVRVPFGEGEREQKEDPDHRR